MQYFESFKAPVIKFSPELNADCKCPHPKLEICHKSRQVFTTQQLRNVDVKFCIFVYLSCHIFFSLT